MLQLARMLLSLHNLYLCLKPQFYVATLGLSLSQTFKCMKCGLLLLGFIDVVDTETSCKTYFRLCKCLPRRSKYTTFIHYASMEHLSSDNGFYPNYIIYHLSSKGKSPCICVPNSSHPPYSLCCPPLPRVCVPPCVLWPCTNVSQPNRPLGEQNLYNGL